MEYLHRVFPEDGDSYCSNIRNSPLTVRPKFTYDLATIIGIAVVATIGVVIVGLFIYYCCKKEKITGNAMKMTMSLTRLEDNEPLRPTNVLPNIAN